MTQIKLEAKARLQAVAVDQRMAVDYANSLGFKGAKVVRTSDDYCLMTFVKAPAINTLIQALGQPKTLRSSRTGVRLAIWKVPQGYIQLRGHVGTLELTNTPQTSKENPALVIKKYESQLRARSSHNGSYDGPSLFTICNDIWSDSPTWRAAYWAIAKSNYGTMAAAYKKSVGPRFSPEVVDLLIETSAKAKKIIKQLHDNLLKEMVELYKDPQIHVEAADTIMKKLAEGGKHNFWHVFKDAISREAILKYMRDHQGDPLNSESTIWDMIVFNTKRGWDIYTSLQR